MRKVLLLVGLFLLPCPAPACSLCGAMSRSMSLAYEYNESAVVLYGTLANPKLGTKPGMGTTEFHVERIVKNDAGFPKDQKVLLLSRYLPILDAKTPPKHVMFVRSPKENLEPYWGKEISSPAVLDFLAELHKLRGNPAEVLIHAAKQFDHADVNVADEAFMIFAKADDKLIAQMAKKLSPVNLRKLVKDPDLEPERMSMFAYLLGACGDANDVEVLRSLIKNPPRRFYKSYEGILAGYITMQPAEGWALANETLTNGKHSFLLRFATLRTLRFFYNARPDEAGPRVMNGLSLALGQSDIADIAIEDLRKWKRWEHTKDVVACWDKNGFQSAIVKQSIIRYALACPLPETRTLLERARRQEPELVRDLEQELK